MSNFAGSMGSGKHEDFARDLKKTDARERPTDYRHDRLANQYPMSPYSRSEEAAHVSQTKEERKMLMEQERKAALQSTMKVRDDK